MRRIIIFILKVVLIIIVASVSYRYFKIYQDGKINEVNHFEEAGKGTGEAIKGIGEGYNKIKNSQQLKDLKEGINQGMQKDSI